MKKTGPIQRLLSLALTLAMLLSLTAIGAAAEESTVSYDADTGVLSGVSGYETVEDALLYTIDGDYTLIYDVTYTADTAEALVFDATGQGIEDIDTLAEELNELDDAFTADLYLDADGNAAVILITECVERPVIGISWKSDTQDYSTFIEELYRNGAIAVELPQVYDAESAQAALAAVDGIMVTGGEDVDPTLYGEEAYAHGSSGINEERDTSDINLIQQAIAMDVPMLAICRGEQIFNVAMGGALIQDIPTYLAALVESGAVSEDAVTTVIEDTGYWDGVEMVECVEAHYRVWLYGLIHSGGTGYHEISDISTDSKWLYDIVGDTSIEVAATAHHQAVDPDRLGDGLTIVAYAADGIVEAIEYQDNLFALGIQFHPERDALEDTRGVDVDQDLCNRFLRTLVEYGSVYAELKAEAEEEEESVIAETVEDALLYTIDEDYTLIYDVTYTTDVSDAVVMDTTGQGIDSVDILAEELNELDDAFSADLYLDADGNAAVILITECVERPVIGISWKSDTQDYSTFIEELYRNGAIAVELPQIYDAESAQAALAEVDGIMVTGGEDVDPTLYGEEAYAHGSSGINEERDTSDINLIQQAIAMDVPMLAICRGEQIFNVAMGGALIQDIPTYLAALVESGEIDESRVTTVIEDTGYWSGVEMVECVEAHYRVWVDGLIHSGGTGYHEISDISTDSKWMYDIVGDTSIEVAATAHHQAVDPDRLGDGLTIVAYASDGIVEAIEYQDNLFALGIQFHPERDALEDTRGVDVDQDLCNRFLRTLVEYGSVYAELKAEAEEEETSFTFADDDGTGTWLWASDYIYTCYEAGIINGYTDGTYLPDDSLTRAEAAKIIAEALGLTSDAETSSFSDVSGHWALQYIEACAEAGIINGYTDGTFRPDDTVSRAELAKMIAVAVGIAVDSEEDLTSSFSDVSDSHWALMYIEMCAAEGIINGIGDGKFAPEKDVTRAEAAAMIARALDLAE